MVEELECPEQEDIEELVRNKDEATMYRALIALLHVAIAKPYELCPDKKNGWKGITLRQVQLKELTIGNNKPRPILMIEGVRTRKPGKGYIGTRDIPVDPIKDKFFVDALKDYTSKLFPGLNPELFPMSTTTIRRILKRVHPDLIPYMLKYARLRELAARGYDDKELRYLAGWTRSKPAKNFTKNISKYGRVNLNIILARHFKGETI